MYRNRETSVKLTNSEIEGVESSLSQLNSININIRNLNGSPTLSINEALNELISSGKTVFRLGMGQSPFPIPISVVNSLKRNAHQNDYLPVKGLKKLRKAVADYQNRKSNNDYTLDDVLIGPGSKELMFLLQLAFYGELIIPAPSWVSYEPQAKITGKSVRWITTSKNNDWKLTAQEFAQFCSTAPECPRILVLNYPSNPSGATYSGGELEAIANVAKNNNVIVLSDEIYGELNHNGLHQSISTNYPSGTIISSGLSKWCGAGGWRLGTLIFPKELRRLQEAVVIAASETYTSVSAPIQWASIEAFNGNDEISDYINKSRKILRGLGLLIYEKMRSFNVGMPKPAGGFYLMPDFSYYKNNLLQRGISTNMQLCSTLVSETGVALIPGNQFGLPEHELVARLAYVDFDGKNALDAAAGLDKLEEDFYFEYCKNVMDAIDAISNWISRGYMKQESDNYIY